MSTQDASTLLTLTASREDALQALLDALPKDAVIRDEDDGVGRFAGQRTVAIIGRSRNRVMLFEGGWGSIKQRLEEPRPTVDVVFEEREKGVKVRITAEPPQKTGPRDYIYNVVNNGLVVAVAVVAYYWFKSIPIDYALVAGIGAGGGLLWTVVTAFMPTKEVPGPDDLVRKALAPMVKKKKKKKKKAKPAPEEHTLGNEDGGEDGGGIDGGDDGGGGDGGGGEG